MFSLTCLLHLWTDVVLYRDQGNQVIHTISWAVITFKSLLFTLYDCQRQI